MPFEFFHSSVSSAPKVDIPALGLELTVQLPQAASDGSLVVFETVNAVGFGPPLHRHRETEIFRVLEGEYLYEVDGRRFIAATGDLVTVPGGSAHTFTNISASPARQLVVMVPGMDAVEFFTGLGEVLAKSGRDRAALERYGAPWGIEFLGPPIHADSKSK
jgi:quercetin dioxygenase-like cupin family protein